MRSIIGNKSNRAEIHDREY